MGFPLSSLLVLRGQDKDGRDAIKDVNWLVLEADAQVGLQHPYEAIRVFEATPDDFLKRVCEVIRLGRDFQWPQKKDRPVRISIILDIRSINASEKNSCVSRAFVSKRAVSILAGFFPLYGDECHRKKTIDPRARSNPYVVIDTRVDQQRRPHGLPLNRIQPR